MNLYVLNRFCSFFLSEKLHEINSPLSEEPSSLISEVSGDLEQLFGVCEKRSGSETLDLERWRFNLTVLYKLHFLKVLI